MGWLQKRMDVSAGSTSAADFRLGRLERRLFLSGGDHSPSLSSLWNLNSLPGAPATLYLDFDGEPARTWASYDVPETPAYDTDGDPASFSTREVGRIVDIWERVSEKFSPFNINVTTARPDSFGDREALQVVIGGDGAWIGSHVGGIAQRGSFYNRAANTVWVFEDNLWDGQPKYVAEAAAHEAGHAFGLAHQSSYDASGQLVDEYNRGDALRAPIAGSAYSSTRGLWWHGTSRSATTIQDDLSILAGDRNDFGYRPNDHGGSTTAATWLTSAENSLTASGVIHHMTDEDWFGFNTAAGTLHLTADVAEHGPMLDLKLGLHDARGHLVASADTSDLGEMVTADVAEGTYYISVASHGEYGDIGQYTLSGTLPSGPAGNSALRQVARQLVLTGTGADDALSISYDASSETLIINLNGEVTRHNTAGLTGLRILTGDGDDLIEIDAGVTLPAEVHAGRGNDYVVGGSGDDRLFGEDDNDTLVGGNGRDMLRGGAGHDLLNGTAGNDSLWGHVGNDTLFGGSGDDVLRGGEDDDVLRGGAGNDTLLGHAGDDDLLGQEGANLLRGHGGADRLFAGLGNDALDGGEGEDQLDGRRGYNILLGGQGSDVFVGDRQASIFADYDIQRDWLAEAIGDAREGGVKRYRDESTGYFTASHPAYDRLVAAFDHDVYDVHGLRTEYGRQALM